MRTRSLAAWTIVTAVIAAGCAGAESDAVEIARFPLDSLEGVLTRSGVELDAEISRDGGGSLRAAATEPVVVRLFEVEDPDVENARLIYRAALRSEDLEGRTYLEMWCRFPGKGEFFSRGLHAPLSGSVEWTSQEIPFFLEKGQNPDLLKLNLVIEGRGTVWIDDVVVLAGPLR